MGIDADIGGTSVTLSGDLADVVSALGHRQSRETGLLHLPHSDLELVTKVFRALVAPTHEQLLKSSTVRFRFLADCRKLVALYNELDDRKYTGCQDDIVFS